MKKILGSLLEMAIMSSIAASATEVDVPTKPTGSSYKLPLTDKQKKARQKNKQQKKSRKINR